MPAPNAIPGLKRLPKPGGFFTWYWSALQISRVSDFKPRTVRLWHGQGGPSAHELEHIRARAQQLTLDLREHRPGSGRQRRFRSKRGTIYIVRAGERVKIGFSTDVIRRVAQLQAFFPEDLDLLLTMPGSILMEKELHRRFAAFQLQREWFLYVPPIAAFIDAMSGRNTQRTSAPGQSQNHQSVRIGA